MSILQDHEGGNHDRAAALVMVTTMFLLLSGCGSPSNKYLSGDTSKSAWDHLLACDYDQALAEATSAADSDNEAERKSGLFMQLLVYEDQTQVRHTQGLLNEIVGLPGNEDTREDVIKHAQSLLEDLRARRKHDTGDEHCPK